jgi:CDGSH-type Zn-finger protein/uncharacterized Fe-S cluster protein YjdI
MGPKVREYAAKGITVSYDVQRCIHAHECVRGLPRVFDVKRRVWIDATQASPEAIATVIKRCPTGALHFRRNDGGASEEIPERNEVRVMPDGPLYVRGEVEIQTPAEIIHETRAALCRCGASANKPFCDNSHQRMDFHDASASRVEGDVAATVSGRLRVLPQINGPCLMEGALVLVDQDGAILQRLDRSTYFCRCGQSANKPFCDGSHRRVGFTAE